MKPVIVYPVPLESPEVVALFKPFVERFTRTLREIEPGCDYEVAAIVNGGSLDDFVEARRDFHHLPVKYPRYDCSGADIGSFQFAAQMLEPCFMVCCVSRVHFWKAGWLRRLVEAREQFGPGFYTTSASREGGRFHGCTRCYAMDSEHFNRYPLRVDSREYGTSYEIGLNMRTGQPNPHGAVWQWFRDQGLQSRVVYWDETPELLDVPGAYCLSLPNIYRRGDQSQLLVSDKHSQAYEEADEEEKRRLEAMCFGQASSTG